MSDARATARTRRQKDAQRALQILGILILCPALTIMASATADAAVVVSSATATPSTVTPGESVTISWSVATTSPVTQTNVVVYAPEPDGNLLPSSVCSTATLESGTSTNGSYKATCSVPSTDPDGSYQTYIEVTDSAGDNDGPIGPAFTLTGSSPLSASSTPSSPVMPAVAVSSLDLVVTPTTHQAATVAAIVACNSKSKCTVEATLYELLRTTSSAQAHVTRMSTHVIRIEIARSRVAIGSNKKVRVPLLLNGTGRRQLQSASERRPVVGDQLVVSVAHGITVTRSVTIE